MSKITKIEVQKRNKNRVNVFIDEEFAFACDGELVYKCNLNVKEEIELSKIESIVKEDNFIKCKNSALRVIEKAHKTEKEIIDKLILKGFDKNSIEKTIKFLKEYNFINDNKFVEIFVKDKIKNQGRKKIKYSLLKKGVSEDLIEDKINNIDSNVEETSAYSLCLKKYNNLIKREEDKYKLYQKLYRFLASKGYSYSCISDTVKKVMNTDDFME
ncbi:recombination regulator RecX [Clostridium fallax]|uniref:Regulatory protein RecX n=1 Tax=Clostridium fallax TaxID=1533 RepID=A0A1M4YSG1_9CLOT|nr:recombination regulator RecX [Clostridium fallax]SHF08286.1 regulatory protein [Clostridium fallax]SQB06220.1 recombination regulator RecX [Clostridium fallax]